MNMRCDPDWADHAREDWIFEQHQKELEKNANGPANNNKSTGILEETSELQSGGVADGLPIIVSKA